jgi:uncharacterized membrane protein YkoI
MRRLLDILVAAILVVLFGFSDPGHAASPFNHSFTPDEARDAREQGRVLGASEVMRIVQRRYPNLKVADARLVSNGRRGATYRVKMLSRDGRVVEVTVDAKSGQILGTRGN